MSKKNESPNKKRKTVYWRIAIAEQEATAKAVNASLTLENFDEAVNTTLQILGEGAGCKRINILENFFDIIQQLKLDFSSLHLYRENGSKSPFFYEGFFIFRFLMSSRSTSDLDIPVASQ